VSGIVAPEGWTVTPQGLFRKFEFDDFGRAFAFMTRVAAAAEAADHHPDWSNSWNVVRISLISHDVGSITDRDLGLAETINTLV
jgi:4a-hydroxytetrahydrobiopterin dehydratase